MYITLYEIARLFFISVFNMVVFRDPKKQHYLKLFVYVFFTKLISNETFVPLFIHSLFLIPFTPFFNRTQDSSLLNLEIYKTKKITLLIIFGDIFLGAQAVDCYHFGSRCDPASSRTQTGNLWFPSAIH